MAMPLTNIEVSPSLLDKNQSPVIENKNAPIINQISFGGLADLMFKISNIRMPKAALPDL